jgi:hypothetical protein
VTQAIFMGSITLLRRRIVLQKEGLGREALSAEE